MRRDKIAAMARVLDIPPAVLMDWETFDAEEAERRRIVKEFTDYLNVASFENIKITLDLLKKLEER